MLQEQQPQKEINQCATIVYQDLGGMPISSEAIEILVSLLGFIAVSSLNEQAQGTRDIFVNPRTTVDYLKVIEAINS